MKTTPKLYAHPFSSYVRHWTTEDYETHQKIGFAEGWGKATDQLATLVATL